MVFWVIYCLWYLQLKFLCFFRSILLKERIQPVLPMLDQIIDGLRQYVLNLAKENSELFRYVFSPSKCLTWTFEKFAEFLFPSYSEDGTSKKVAEIDKFKAFMDAMKSFFL